MSRYEHGRVLAVNETTLGSELVGDHAAGVGSLTVEDPVDFDEDGGWLKIADQVVEYSTYDDDTGEITLKGTLNAAAGEGDRVDLWDELRQVVTVDKIAQVELDGDDDNTDPLEATIPLHLLDDLTEGIRGIRGESVLLEQDGDEWRIVDVLGMAAEGASGNQFWNDPHTVTAPGQQTIALTHEPINNSEHLYWNGLYQPASEWSRNGQTITVPDAGGHLLAGDELVVEYAYRVGALPPWQTLVNWETTDWRGLSISKSDTTDRSAPSFDDTSWATYWAPVSDTLDPHPTWSSVPAPHSTGFADGAGLWLRRTVQTQGIREVRVSARADNHADVYWNGTLLGTLSDRDDVGGFLEVPSALIATENTLAIRATDDNLSGASVNRTYIDVRVEGR